MLPVRWRGREVIPAGMGTARVRVIDALLCPEGIALQTVTLMSQGRVDIQLNGWRLLDGHGRMEALDGLVLLAREPLTVTISGLGARFTGRGGSILLIDPQRQVVHVTRYRRMMPTQPRARTLS